MIEHVVVLAVIMFLFRFRSLYSFVKEFRNNKTAQENLERYFSIYWIPSDDDIRYVLQTVPTRSINRLIQMMQYRLERKKHLKQQMFLNRYYLVSVDGTGHIGSYRIVCPRCLEIMKKRLAFYYYGKAG